MSEEKDPKKQYISLLEASNLCRYSQEYLSLRARQGKLKAVKLGRNWVTTRNWLENYLAGAEEYNLKINGNGHDHKKIEILRLPPENLPIGEIKIYRVKPFWALAVARLVNFFKGEFNRTIFFAKRVERNFNNFTSQPKLIFKTQIFLIVALFFLGIFIQTLGSRSKQEDFFSKNIILVEKSFNYCVSMIQPRIQIKDSFYAGVVSDTAQTFNDYFSWLSSGFSQKANLALDFLLPEDIRRDFGFIFEKSKTGYSFLSNTIEGMIYLSVNEANNKAEYFSETVYFSTGNIFNSVRKVYGKIVAFFENVFTKFANALGKFAALFMKKNDITQNIKKQENGIVVVPSTGKESKDEEIKKKIEENFSDEVRVEIKDEVSGIITPVFKSGNGENYLYMMVPLNKN